MRIVIKGLLLECLGVTQSRNVVVITYNLKNKLCQTVLWFQFSSNKKRNDLDQISCACNFEKLEKSKNTKILNSEENSKRKVQNQKAKSKVQTHQTNG